MKKLVIFAVMMAVAIGAVAQTENKGKAKCNVTPEERIERQVKRMQGQLMLGDDASSKFATLYKQYLSDLNSEADKVKEARNEMNKKRADGSLTEKDIKNYQTKQLEYEKKKTDLRGKYYDKFGKILNAHQLQKVMFDEQGGDRGIKRMGRRMGKANGKCDAKCDSQQVRKVRTDRFGMPRVQHTGKKAALSSRAKIAAENPDKAVQQSVRSDER